MPLLNHRKPLSQSSLKPKGPQHSQDGECDTSSTSCSQYDARENGNFEQCHCKGQKMSIIRKGTKPSGHSIIHLAKRYPQSRGYQKRIKNRLQPYVTVESEKNKLETEEDSHHDDPGFVINTNWYKSTWRTLKNHAKKIASSKADTDSSSDESISFDSHGTRRRSDSTQNNFEERIVSNKNLAFPSSGDVEVNNEDQKNKYRKIELSVPASMILESDIVYTNPLTPEVSSHVSTPNQITKVLSAGKADTKSARQIAVIKTTGQITDTKRATQITGTKTACQITDTKRASQITGTKTAGQIADTKCASEIADTKTAGQITYTKCASQITGTKTAGQITDAKHASQITGTKTACQITDTKPVGQIADTKSASQVKETKPACQITDTKCASQITCTKTAGQITDTKHASQITGTKTAAEITDAKPAGQIADTKSASQVRETKPAGQITDTKCASQITCRKTACQITDTKCASQITGTQTACQITDTKRASQITGTKTACQITDTNSESEITGTKTAGQLTYTKCASQITGTKTAGQITDTKHASQITGTKTAGQITDTKPAGQIADTKSTSQVRETKPAGQIADTKCASQITGTKTACQITDTKRASQITGTKTAGQITDTKRASQITGTKTACQITDTNSESKITGTKTAGQITYNKCASQITGTKTACQITDTKSASQITGTKTAGQITDTKPAGQIADSTSASQVKETKPAGQIEDTKSASQIMGTKTACQITDTKRASQITGTKAVDQVTDTKSAGHIADTKCGSQIIGTKTAGQIADTKHAGQITYSKSASQIITTKTEGQIADTKTEGQDADTKTAGQIIETGSASQIADTKTAGQIIETASASQIADTKTADQIRELMLQKEEHQAERQKAQIEVGRMPEIVKDTENEENEKHHYMNEFWGKEKHKEFEACRETEYIVQLKAEEIPEDASDRGWRGGDLNVKLESTGASEDCMVNKTWYKGLWMELKKLGNKIDNSEADTDSSSDESISDEKQKILQTGQERSFDTRTTRMPSDSRNELYKHFVPNENLAFPCSEGVEVKIESWDRVKYRKKVPSVQTCMILDSDCVYKIPLTPAVSSHVSTSDQIEKVQSEGKAGTRTASQIRELLLHKEKQQAERQKVQMKVDRLLEILKDSENEKNEKKDDIKELLEKMKQIKKFVACTLLIKECIKQLENIMDHHMQSSKFADKHAMTTIIDPDLNIMDHHMQSSKFEDKHALPTIEVTDLVKLTLCIFLLGHTTRQYDAEEKLLELKNAAAEKRSKKVQFEEIQDVKLYKHESTLIKLYRNVIRNETCRMMTSIDMVVSEAEHLFGVERTRIFFDLLDDGLFHFGSAGAISDFVPNMTESDVRQHVISFFAHACDTMNRLMILLLGCPDSTRLQQMPEQNFITLMQSVINSSLKTKIKGDKSLSSKETKETGHIMVDSVEFERALGEEIPNDVLDRHRHGDAMIVHRFVDARPERTRASERRENRPIYYIYFPSDWHLFIYIPTENGSYWHHLVMHRTNRICQHGK